MTRRDPHGLAVAGVLAVVSAVLLITATPGTFSIDEASYVATITGLRDGGLAVAGTEGLPPSPELLGFDANPRGRGVIATPVTSSSPPLYAPIALPFSWFGIRGLIALQILSFAACAALIFAFVRRETQRVDLAWLALGAYLFATFSIEYAQGVWPQSLAMALAMGAIDLASRVRRGASPWLAAAAGACAALAAGIRYQDVVLVATVGVGLAWVPRERRRAAALAFALGCAPVVIASSAMNHVRYDSWNPISKGGAYLQVADERTEASGVIWQAVASTWSRVVDFSTWPSPPPGMAKEPRTGAITLAGGIKKSLVQSAPWVLIPLLAMLLAALRRASFEPPARRELLALGVVIAGTIGMFAVYGYRRYDGWCFNQRYLLELMPVLVAALAIVIATTALSLRALAAAAAATFVLALAVLRHEWAGPVRELVVMKAPLVIAAAGVAIWLAVRRGPARPALLGAALGAGLGWAAAMHFGDDVPASRAIRTANAARLAAVRDALPADRPIALFAYWGNKDPFGTLPLDRDVIVVDPWIDEGRTARAVADGARAAGRSVFILLPMPGDVLSAVAAQHRLVPTPGLPDLLELQP